MPPGGTHNCQSLRGDRQWPPALPGSGGDNPAADRSGHRIGRSRGLLGSEKGRPQYGGDQHGEARGGGGGAHPVTVPAGLTAEGPCSGGRRTMGGSVGGSPYRPGPENGHRTQPTAGAPYRRAGALPRRGGHRWRGGHWVPVVFTSCAAIDSAIDLGIDDRAGRWTIALVPKEASASTCSSKIEPSTNCTSVPSRLL